MDNTNKRPLRIINSVAPIRICDNGGWTDTWFAEHGKIFNIGVYPYAEVQVEVYPLGSQEERIVIYAENYGERFAVRDGKNGYDRHPLLEAAIERMKVPTDTSLKVTIYSEAPAGASTGTSAAVAVALVGALDHLTPSRMTPHEVAYTAQSIETDMLHLQCGIQDQLCSAYGGINYIEMFQISLCHRLTIADSQLELVGTGTPPGTDLFGQIAQLVQGTRQGDPSVRECRADLQATGGPAQNGGAFARCHLRRGFRSAGPGDDREHRGAGAHASRTGVHRGLEDHRNRQIFRRTGLESERRRRRWRLRHHFCVTH